MAGTTKTVNAGNYRIDGMQQGGGGVDLKSGQTLNINGGIWENWDNNLFDVDAGVKLNVNGAKFINNYTSSQGGAVVDDLITGTGTTTINFTDTDFLYNTSIAGGALCLRDFDVNIKSSTRDVTMSGNKATSASYGGGVMRAGNNILIEAQNNHNIY